MSFPPSRWPASGSSATPRREVIFVGTERGMEKRLIPEAGLQLETIRAAGLKGLGAIRVARNLMQLGPGFCRFGGHPAPA